MESGEWKAYSPKGKLEKISQIDAKSIVRN